MEAIYTVTAKAVLLAPYPNRTATAQWIVVGRITERQHNIHITYANILEKYFSKATTADSRMHGATDTPEPLDYTIACVVLHILTLHNCHYYLITEHSGRLQILFIRLF